MTTPGHDDDDEDDSISGQLDPEESSTSCSQSKGKGDASESSSDQKVRFVQKESQYVLFLRIGVLLVLLLAAAAVCVMVWLIMDSGEQNAFDSHFAATAEKIRQTFMEIATDKMGAAGSLVVAIVAQGNAATRGDAWPFVTMSAFQERAATTMKLSGAIYLGTNPLVTDGLREEWEAYSNFDEDAKWYQQAIEYQTILGFNELDNRPQVETDDPNLDLCCGIANRIYDYDRDVVRKGVISPDEPFYLPVWQTSPATKRTMVNQNRASNSEGARNCIATQQVVVEGMEYAPAGFGTDDNPFTAEIAWMLRMANRKKTEYYGDIYSTVYFPLYNNFSTNRTVVGVMRVVIHWARYFDSVLPASTRGVVVVLENSCDEPFTYEINGAKVVPVGHGDLHDHAYDSYELTSSFRDITSIEDGTAKGMILNQGRCPYSIRIYPSAVYVNDYITNTPLLITFSVACVFVFAILMFFVYDRLVERRQHILLQKATQTHKIVASLFPKNVRDRLLDDGHDAKKGGFVAQNRLKSFLNGNDDTTMGQAPIADLFPHATVLFADISGFTAWSSSREPSQVFILLQCVYQGFDEIAKYRKVFKIETIGDSYVAVTGVPEPQANHAVIMARFASECMVKMAEVVRNLESSLGPDTGELTMRFGINSGPVTAGVLRGERSRFQLFGDTMNTASRMESTGIAGKIQATQSTADLLIKAGKQHWVRAREDNVHAKGKGVLQTFWIAPHAKKGTSNGSSETGSSDNVVETQPTTEDDLKSAAIMKHRRHIDWMVELLLENIRLIVARRKADNQAKGHVSIPIEEEGHIALDEVVEAIALPDFDDEAATADARSVELSEDIVADLREYVAIIASAYRDNPFHNFEHACHVTMSVSKFLKRIVTPELEMEELNKIKDENKLARKIASHLHDYTHGINSDPIALFAIVFSALIHDVDHRGVSNMQLMKEEPNMADIFRNKSIAEQNSLEVSWNLLVSERFDRLRDFIFGDEESLLRFRQVIVNVVLATDIFDKELNDLRKARWEKAFSEACVLTKEKNALRATIVMEHIMQASDVCHTMQHWHIYRKWNERLFMEMAKAYKEGRMGADPATFWYKGELGFFDNYIIPLANKLKDCNVFGASSDECLNYALMNRAEWEARGENIVAEMIEKGEQPIQGNL